MAGLALASVAAVGTQVSKIFQINLELVIFSTSMLLIGSVCTVFFNVFFMEKLGLKNVNLIFAVVNMIAAILKFFLP